MTINDAIPSANIVEVKSRLNSEFRRVAISAQTLRTVDSFYTFFLKLHHVHNERGTDQQYDIYYMDPSDNELLPINNDTNYMRALKMAKPLLRLFLMPKQGNHTGSTMNLKSLSASSSHPANITSGGHSVNSKEVRPVISKPVEFRQIAAIIDVDVIPETLRRVKLLKHSVDKPLGFFIRDGISMRQTNTGLKKAPGIFISRLVPGGLAEMTGLLSVNDEVMEVNGIDVYGKTLDQVTDMMVANSSNLIITVKPVNQRNNPATSGGALSAAPYKGSTQSMAQSRFSLLSQGDDEPDEVVDLLQASSSHLQLNTIPRGGDGGENQVDTSSSRSNLFESNTLGRPSRQPASSSNNRSNLYNL